MSAIVLAAGSNTRLQPLVAPHQKPLLLINGKPLIKHAIDHAIEFWDVRESNINIVVSPHNAANISSVLSKDDIQYTLQARPLGIIDALKRAIRSCDKDLVLILCSDNIFGHNFHSRNSIFSRIPSQGLYSVIAINEQLSSHLTKLHYDSDQKIHYLATSNTVPVSWVGPLLAPRTILIDALNSSKDVETLINLLCKTNRFYGVKMNCSDLGIPEAL